MCYVYAVACTVSGSGSPRCCHALWARHPMAALSAYLLAFFHAHTFDTNVAARCKRHTRYVRFGNVFLYVIVTLMLLHVN